MYKIPKKDLDNFLKKYLIVENNMDKIVQPTKVDFANNSNGYGWLQWTGKVYHPGVDYNRGYGWQDLGDPIYAVARGKVTYVKNKDTDGWGKHLFIKHKDINHPTFGKITFWTHYAHCKEILVGVDQEVKSGQTIAKVGTTGESTAPHLHFEIRKRPLGVTFYPNGKSKKWIEKNYYNPNEFI
jgi:murein DD-endopeptidase MepM/ murein hydrolase activator NlpD